MTLLKLALIITILSTSGVLIYYIVITRHQLKTIKQQSIEYKLGIISIIGILSVSAGLIYYMLQYQLDVSIIGACIFDILITMWVYCSIKNKQRS